jgi:predicted enzyme related to lactoylglutathione lyase
MSNDASQSEMKPGHIGWNELVTPDPAGAIKFYTTLFGWETEKFPMPKGEYTMFKHAGKPFGGVMATPRPGAPTQWTDYVIVADIDATLAKSTSLGGKTCVGPMEIPDVGRIAIIQDPQGALIGVHQSA